MTQPYGQQPGGNQPGGGGFPPAPAAPAYQQGAGGMPQAPQEYGGGPQRRPGVVTAAAVLAFVQGGITTITTILVWLGVANAPSSAAGSDTAFALALAVGQTIGVVLLIWGGVQAIGGSGRTALVVGAALEIVISLVYIIRFVTIDTAGFTIEAQQDAADTGKSILIFVAVLFAVMPAITLVLAMGQQSTQYLESRRR
jgi:uncharacterized membrane protein